MSIVTASDARRFIETARFAGTPRARAAAARVLAEAPSVELETARPQSLVVGSGLVVAAERVPKQTREDLVNCTLFAQLAASGEVSDSSELDAWYEAYFRALTTLGWAQSDRHFEEHEYRGKNAEAHKAILPVLAALLGPQAAALVLVKTTLEALQSMEANRPWITLFDHQSRSGRSARFQVVTAQADARGLLTVALGAFKLKARSQITQVLFFKYASSSTSLRYAAGEATIYEAALAEQRAAIAARLTDYRSAYVGQVRFPPPPGTAQPPR
jgi:hypothetical protein